MDDHDTDEEAKATGSITNSIKFKAIAEHDNNSSGFCCIFGSSKKNKPQDKKYMSNKERKIKKKAMKDMERMGEI